MSRYLKIAALIATTIGLWIFILSRVQLQSVVLVLAETGPLQVVLCLVLALIGPVVHAVRWSYYTRSLEVKLPFGVALKTILACQPASVFAPAHTGDLLRAIVLRKSYPFGRMATSIVLEKLVGMLIVAVLAGAGWLLTDFATAVAVKYVLLGLALVILALAVNFGIEKMLALAARYTSYIPVNGDGPSKHIATGPLLIGFLLSLANWILTMLLIFACFCFYDAPLDYWVVMSSFSIAVLVTMLPVSLGGFGSREAAMLLLLKGQAPAATIVAVCLIYGFLVLGTRLMLSIPFGANLIFDVKKMKEAD